MQRDVAERGWTEEQVREDIDERLPDFSAYVDPQKADADVVSRDERSDRGLPRLRVKLIRRKGGFPHDHDETGPRADGQRAGHGPEGVR